MRTASRMACRMVAPLLSGLLMAATSACVGGNPLAAGPHSRSPLPTEQRPLLRKQAQDLRKAIDVVVRFFPVREIEARKLLNNNGTDCYSVDGDDPDPGPTTENWEYAVRVRLTGTNADHEATLMSRLPRDGWALGRTEVTGELIAVKQGMYLEIELLDGDDETGSHPNSENLVVRGHSRCVRADGAIKTPNPPGPLRPLPTPQAS